MAKISTGAPWFGHLPFIGPAPTSGSTIALPARPIAGTIVGAFFVVGVVAWALSLAHQAAVLRSGVLDHERAAFQPSQYVRAELSAGYVGRTLLP